MLAILWELKANFQSNLNTSSIEVFVENKRNVWKMYSEFTQLLLQFISYLDKVNDQVSHYFHKT